MRPEREPGPLGTLISDRCILAVYDFGGFECGNALPLGAPANLFQFVC